MADKAESAAERRIREFFEANASEELKAKAAAEGKDAAGALKYCREQARKLAVNGVAAVEDETVFSWAMHWYQDEPAPGKGDEPGKKGGPDPKKKKRKKKAPVKRNAPGKGEAPEKGPDPMGQTVMF